jgi:hypothetical protein
MSDVTDIVVGSLIVVVADLVVYSLVGTLGKRSAGRGARFRPFSGGEEGVPERGVYRSSLFVFAAMFLVAEAFALLLAGAVESDGAYYPLLFLGGGGAGLVLATWWFLTVGGGKF